MMAKACAASGKGQQWDAINWPNIEANVSRLQARIVKAVQENRWNKVRVLSYLLTRSMSGKFLATSRVTSNKGRNTAGVDGITWDSPAKRFAGALSLKSRGLLARSAQKNLHSKSQWEATSAWHPYD
ncbi:reverse transcriptase N-terminal domain-containing protein [Pantoea sp. VS1]|uniref:reverse transcriptase N-terminal domain-containing protein n=1 Tax=Pantoea sp. VS1 TaxID=2003658 RepID=UPI0020CCF083|nr:reverse transcriptase N-terminal domain-containing protein [Pantoea sp. VS1]